MTEFSSSLIGLTFIDCMLFMIVTLIQEIPVLYKFSDKNERGILYLQMPTAFII